MIHQTKQKFKSFISDLSKDISVKDLGDDGFYEISDDNSEEVKIYFNDDIAMLLIDMNRNDLSFKKVRDKLLNLDKSNSILSNEIELVKKPSPLTYKSLS